MKNTDGAEHKGYDAGKKVSGIKRHILVGSQGLPHAITVTTANVTDRQGALEAIKQNPGSLSEVSVVMTEVVIPDRILPKQWNHSSVHPYKWPKETNCTPFQSFPSAGWLKDRLPG